MKAQFPDGIERSAHSPARSRLRLRRDLGRGVEPFASPYVAASTWLRLLLEQLESGRVPTGEALTRGAAGGDASDTHARTASRERRHVRSGDADRTAASEALPAEAGRHRVRADTATPPRRSAASLRAIDGDFPGTGLRRCHKTSSRPSRCTALQRRLPLESRHPGSSASTAAHGRSSAKSVIFPSSPTNRPLRRSAIPSDGCSTSSTTWRLSPGSSGRPCKKEEHSDEGDPDSNRDMDYGRVARGRSVPPARRRGKPRRFPSPPAPAATGANPQPAPDRVFEIPPDEMPTTVRSVLRSDVLEDSLSLIGA